jgi:cell division transport system permease protein
MKYGWLGLWRNRWLTLSAIGVMIITLFVLSSLLVIYQLAGLSSQNLQDRVDISVYFKADSAPDKIQEVKKEFEAYEEVKTVNYISAEQALADFKNQHKDDVLIQQTLVELQDNPLQASLTIKAKELAMYPVIFQKIQRTRYQPLIANVNYEDNRLLIERLDSITGGIRNFGAILVAVLGAIAVLVMFNTFQLTIFSRREEIEIMRLVGASNFYIRGPFLFEGIFYGLAGTLISCLIFYPLLTAFRPSIGSFFGLDLGGVGYFGWGFVNLALIQLVAAIVLGVFSSIIATKKYLKI